MSITSIHVHSRPSSVHPVFSPRSKGIDRPGQDPVGLERVEVMKDMVRSWPGPPLVSDVARDYVDSHEDEKRPVRGFFGYLDGHGACRSAARNQLNALVAGRCRIRRACQGGRSGRWSARTGLLARVLGDTVPRRAGRYRKDTPDRPRRRRRLVGSRHAGYQW